MKLARLFVAALMSTALLTGCTENNDPVGIVITSVGNKTSIEEEDTLQLSAAVRPEGATQTVSWTTSNANHATVSSSGLVTGVGAGNVLITATSTIKESVKQDFALTITPKEYVEIAPTWLEIVSVETSVTVGENLSLTVNVEPEDASKSVTWSSDKESVATVSPAGVLRGQGEGKAVITATSKLNDAIKDTIEIEVTPAKGIEPTVDWAAQPFASHDEYMNAAKETPLKVKGTVTYVEPAQVSKDGTHKAASYYIQSGKQGFYVYKQNVDVFPVKLNKTYEVGGFKAYSFHTNEIAKVEHFAEIDESLPWEVVDIFALNVGDTSATKDYTGSYVSLNEAIVDSVPSGFTSAFNIMVSNSKGSIALRADPKVAGQEEFDAIVEKAKTLVVGGSVSVKGLLNTFGYGSPSNQIQIVKASELQINKVTPQQYVDAAASNAMYLPNSVLASQNSIQLPTAVENFPGVEVSWTSDNAAISSTGVVTHSSELVDVTLTATLAYEGATATKQFVVTVFETDDTHYNVVHTLDLEDADPASSGSWGVSPTKSTYDDEGTNAVSLGSPKKASWKLFNALIAGTEADKLVGTLSIRAKGNEDQARSARIEILENYEFDLLEFKTAGYGTHELTNELFIEYSTDSGASWQKLDRKIPVSSRTLETIRVAVPEGANRVAISALNVSSKTFNLDDIRLIRK